MTRLLLALICIFALVAGGCGSDEGGEDDPLAALDVDVEAPPASTVAVAGG